MENLSICRMCLATDVELCSIASHLRHMYERITAMTIQREDKQPLVACYICHAKLQNCYRLRKSCLQSEEQLTEMMSSGVLKLQDVLSINSFRVVSVLHFSLGHTVRDSTECNIKQETLEIIRDAEHDQDNTEEIVTEAQEEQCTVIDDNNQCSHLEDPLNVIKRELDDAETDAEDMKIDIEDTILKENDAGGVVPSSQLSDNLCPKIVKVVLQRIDVNDAGRGSRVLENNKIAAVKDTEDATTNKRRNKGTENITIKEPKIVTKKTEVKKLLTSSKILKTCDKLEIKLNKCEKVVTSIINQVSVEKSTNKSLLQNVSISKYNQFSCDACNKCYSHKSNLERHIRTHSGVKLHQCNFCNKCFISKYNLKSHIRTHTGEKPHKCNVCNKCFTDKSALYKHNRIHTGQKPYQCNFCNKCFISKFSLTLHIRTHTGEKPHHCNVCKSGFTSKCNLKTHIRIHTGEKPHSCNYCNKSFITISDLNRHSRIHTGEKPYQCNICKKYFMQKWDLNEHIRIHTGEKPYQCDHCNKCFMRKKELNIHIRMHTGEIPYKCNVCKISFTSKSSLNTHIHKHTGERAHQCDICKKSFIEKKYLSVHIRTHTGEKPHPCNYCNKCFSTKSALNIHIRIHTGEKPHQCNICKKCFVQKRGLSDHIRTHTGEKPFQCNVCNKCFRRKRDLNYHIRIHTDKTPH